MTQRHGIEGLPWQRRGLSSLGKWADSTWPDYAMGQGLTSGELRDTGEYNTCRGLFQCCIPVRRIRQLALARRCLSVSIAGYAPDLQRWTLLEDFFQASS